MNPLSWPCSTDVPLSDHVKLVFPFQPVEATADEALHVVPHLERAMRAADPTVRSVSAVVRQNAVVRDRSGRTILVHPLALELDVRLACEVLPQDMTRRASALSRGIMRAAMNPERPA